MTSHCYTPFALLKMFISPESLDAICIATLRSSTSSVNMGFGFYLLVFLATCLLEAVVYFPAGIRQNLKIKKIIGQVLILNLATHPIVTFIVPTVAGNLRMSTQNSLLLSEVFAPSVEMLLLILIYRYRWSSAFFVAMSANLFSWWLGIYLFSYF